MNGMTENTLLTFGILASSFLIGGLSGFLSGRLGLRLSEEERYEETIQSTDLPDVLLLGTYFSVTSMIRRGIGPACLRDWALSSMLLAVSVTDLRKKEIPGKPLIFGIVLWFVWLIAGGLVSGMDAWTAFVTGLLSAGVYSGILLLLSLLADRVFQKETLGGGDLRLIFVVMLHLGLLRGLLCLVLSLLAGLIFILVFKQRKIPFAPSIALGTVFSLLIGAFLSGGFSGFFPE